MKNLLFIFLLALTCKSKAQTPALPAELNMCYTVIQQDSIWPLIHKYGVTSKAVLSTGELLRVDSLLEGCIKRNQSGLKIAKYENRIGNFRFVKQCVPALNDKGEKIVWVNGICSGALDNMEKMWAQPVKRKQKQFLINEPYWKIHIIEVDDGGGCFWNVIVNLGTLSYSNLTVNGQ
jgi:hypothetical protein